MASAISEPRPVPGPSEVVRYAYPKPEPPRVTDIETLVYACDCVHVTVCGCESTWLNHSRESSGGVPAADAIVVVSAAEKYVRPINPKTNAMELTFSMSLPGKSVEELTVGT